MSDADFAIPRLLTKWLVLTLPGSAAAEPVLNYRVRNREHMRLNLPPMPDDWQTVSYWEQRLSGDLAEARAGRAFRFFLFAKAAGGALGDVVGDCAISQIFRGGFQAAYLGYNLDANCTGRGLMTEAVTAVIAYAFGPLNLHRLMANYRPENARSAKLLRRVGFVEEGYARNYLFLDGAWRDHILTSLTNPNHVMT